MWERGKGKMEKAKIMSNHENPKKSR
jgi:hypothetical protein